MKTNRVEYIVSFLLNIKISLKKMKNIKAIEEQKFKFLKIFNQNLNKNSNER